MHRGKMVWRDRGRKWASIHLGERPGADPALRRTQLSWHFYLGLPATRTASQCYFCGLSHTVRVLSGGPSKRRHVPGTSQVLAQLSSLPTLCSRGCAVPFYRRGGWSTEQVSTLSEITQLVQRQSWPCRPDQCLAQKPWFLQHFETVNRPRWQPPNFPSS